MNKTELVAAMADAAGLSKKDAEKALKAFTDVVAEELKKDGKVQLVGFGTFEVSKLSLIHIQMCIRDRFISRFMPLFILDINRKLKFIYR